MNSEMNFAGIFTTKLLAIVLLGISICDAFAPHLMYPTVFRFPNFLNHPKLSLVGDSRIEVTELIVAGPGRKQTGAVWFTQPFDVSDGFLAEFAVSVSHVDNRGGEGMAFVVQKDNEYALGGGVDGIGYAGLGEGVAIEFDGRRDSHQAVSEHDKDDDGAHVAVKEALTPGARLHADHDVANPKDVVVPLPNLAQFTRPVEVRIEYSAKSGEIICSFDVAKQGERAQWMEGVRHKVERSFMGGASYFVGFTAATGHSAAARFAVSRWRFGVPRTKLETCVGGFTGPECSVTDEEARRECPRRETCLGCVKNVYNCVWCSSGKDIKSGGACVVGNSESLKECSNYYAEELGCASGVGLIWLWISLGIVSVVLCFGFVLVRTLPRKQAFRAVSLLVALGCGALLGMLLSYVIAAALVEISTTPVFSLAFGLFFFYLGTIVALETSKMRAEAQSLRWEHIASMVAVVWIVIAGVLCFILDKKIVMWMPEGLKVVFYMILSAALNFCVVFSAVDLGNEVYERYTRKSSNTPGLSEMMEGRAIGDVRFFKVARSRARYGLLIMASLLSGLYFGLVFGLMRIEEEKVYRAALMLRQESLLTFPAGALIGGLSGLLLQLIAATPAQSEAEVDRIINEARDDL